MSLQNRIVGRIPVYFGEWDSTVTYAKKNRVTKHGSEFESKVEDNVAHDPIISEDLTTFTAVFDTEHWAVISNGTSAYLAAEKIVDLQNQINKLTASDTNVSLGVSPDVIFRNEETAVSVSSTITKTVGTVSLNEIKRGDRRIAASGGMTASGTDYVNAATDQTYVVNITINGVTISPVSRTLYTVDPIYYGQGASIETIDWQRDSAKRYPSGQKNFTISASGNIIAFDVPNGMYISTMGTPEGLPIPYAHQASSRAGYTTYYTTNSYDAGENIGVIVSGGIS